MDVPSYVMVGVVFVGIVAILGATLLVLQIVTYWKRLTLPPADAQVITRSELDAQTAGIKADMTRMEIDLKADMTRIEIDLKADIRRVESTLTTAGVASHEYIKASVHKLRDDFYAMSLNVERNKAEQAKMMREMVDSAIRPLLEKMDRHTIVLARIEAVLNNKATEEHEQ